MVSVPGILMELNFGKPRFRNFRIWAVGAVVLLNFGKQAFSNIRGWAAGTFMELHFGEPQLRKLLDPGAWGRFFAKFR